MTRRQTVKSEVDSTGHVNRVLDPTPTETLDEYIERGGGDGLAAARRRTPESVIELIAESGLRGRGGAGFPTGTKWRSLATSGAISPPVVINAAEGEPGTFKDRALLRANPYRVLEGACIAAHAMRSTEIIVAVKASFTHEVARLRMAIAAFAAAGWTDDIKVRIVEGPSEYLFGEETALLEVIDGRQPFPRVTPPYRRGIRPAGGDDSLAFRGDSLAVLVDNVETLANIPGIVRNGVNWYRSLGTVGSPGTIMCTVTGATQQHGVGEFVMGTPLRDVLDTVGHGMADDRTIAVVLSGVSNPPLGPEQLDTPLTYEDMAKAGSGLGSASFIVIADDESMLGVAAGVARFLAVESCGQCEPCKRDGLAIADGLSDGDFTGLDNRLETVARGARCALAGQTERVVGALIALSHPAAADERVERYPIVPLVDIENDRAVLDLAFLEKQPDWTYASEARDSFSWPAQHLAGHPVTIRPPHTAEPNHPGAGFGRPLADSDGGAEMFSILHAAQRRIELRLDTLRAASVGERSEEIRRLRDAVEHHRQAVEHVIYPLVSRLEPGVGDDVVWYPEHHEQHASRLLRRLDLAETTVSPRLVDELCADVHAALIEIDLRVLPLLESAVEGDPAELALITAAIDEFLQAQ